MQATCPNSENTIVAMLCQQGASEALLSSDRCADNVLRYLDIKIADAIYIEDRWCISASFVPETHFPEERFRACLHPRAHKD